MKTNGIAKPVPAEVVKPLPASHLQLADQVNREWMVDLAVVRKTDGSQVALEDLFRPDAWAKCVGMLKAGDLLRIIAADKSFDFQLKVSACAQGGVMVKHFPHMPPSIREAEAKVRAEEMTKQRELNNTMSTELNGRPQ